MLNQIVAAMTVVVALVFGTLTIRQWRRTRYLTAAAELVRTMQMPEFTRSIARIVDLEEGLETEKLLADREVMASFYAVSHVFESLGVLVYHRLLPLHLVDHLCGGYVRASWPRVKPGTRQDRGRAHRIQGLAPLVPQNTLSHLATRCVRP